MNAAIPGGAVMDYCKLSPAALEHYKATIDANTLSTAVGLNRCRP